MIFVSLLPLEILLLFLHRTMSVSQRLPREPCLLTLKVHPFQVYEFLIPESYVIVSVCFCASAIYASLGFLKANIYQVPCTNLFTFFFWLSLSLNPHNGVRG